MAELSCPNAPGFRRSTRTALGCSLEATRAWAWLLLTRHALAIAFRDCPMKTSFLGFSNSGMLRMRGFGQAPRRVHSYTLLTWKSLTMIQKWLISPPFQIAQRRHSTGTSPNSAVEVYVKREGAGARCCPMQLQTGLRLEPWQIFHSRTSNRRLSIVLRSDCLSHSQDD